MPGGGLGADAGTPDSKHCNKLSNCVGIDLGVGVGVGTGVAGRKRLSNASRLSSSTRGAVTAATIRSANTHPGSSTVYTSKACSGSGLTILRARRPC